MAHPLAQGVHTWATSSRPPSSGGLQPQEEPSFFTRPQPGGLGSQRADSTTGAALAAGLRTGTGASIETSSGYTGNVGTKATLVVKVSAPVSWAPPPGGSLLTVL